MDNLKEIIFSLTENQQKDFSAFIQRNKYKKERKDLKLYELLKSNQEFTPKQFVSKLKCANLNAYHTIRKRLFKHLSDFIVLQASSTDATETSHLGTLLSVVRYLFDKNLNSYAWKYLQLAEDIAIKNNYFDYLQSIYLLQMDKSFLHPELNFEDLLSKYQENKIYLEQSEKIQIACAYVKKELDVAVKNQTVLNFTKVLNNVLVNLEVNKSILQVPRVALRFVQTLREIALSSKNFISFEDFLTNTINDLNISNSAIINEVESELYYYLAHVQFRNRNFKTSANSLVIANKALNKCAPVFQKKYTIKITQLQAATLLFNNKINEAILTLNTIVNNAKAQQIEHNNALINLGVYNFINGEPKKALQNLNTFNHTDNWYEKLMGIEWVMKKQLMEILLFTELEHIDIVESRIIAFKRKYKMAENHPIYHRVFGFLKIISQVLYFKSSTELQEAIDKHIVFLDNNEEDLQAMTFYAWLKAKAEKKDYYQTLLSIAT